MDEHQARSWLSEPRYGRFLEAVEGNHERAVALYEWHTRLTVASFGLIHHFEVLLRNALDGALGAGQPQTPIKDTWLLDFEILQPDGIKQVITALERLEKGKVVTRGRIVAGLSFGFWAGLFGRRYEELWRHRLRAVFPHGALTRKDLSAKVRLIQHFSATASPTTTPCSTRMSRRGLMTCSRSQDPALSPGAGLPLGNGDGFAALEPQFCLDRETVF
jgi:hypothetical protein